MQSKTEHKRKSVTATFINTGTSTGFNRAELLFGDVFWAKLGRDDDPVRVTTFSGQLWSVKDEHGTILKTWQIGENEQQMFRI